MHCVSFNTHLSIYTGRVHGVLKGAVLKEGNVLFNDTLNTFYLRLYGVKHNGKGPLIAKEETAAAIYASLSD